MALPKVLIVVGPTASGKSALGVKLAKKFRGEVISADSRQVYRGLDIGTGKITKREMQGVPHHLLDIAPAKRQVSASDYVAAAARAIADITERSKLPIIVGGTGFYIDALVGRISLPDISPDKKLRAQLSKKSAAQLYTMLQRLDAKRARAMASPSERNNKVRLIRAIEIARARGKNPTQKKRASYDPLWIGIAPQDSELKDRIEKRLSERIKQGMVKEAQKLRKSGLSFKRMRELGLEYRSLARHLQGVISKSEMERELKSDIWRYARKQIGYWKRNKEIKWFKPTDKKISSKVTRWLKG